MRHRDRTLEAGEDPGKRGSHYANQREVALRDEPLLESATGREDGATTADPGPLEGEARSIDVEAQPMSEVTGHPDPGTTAETVDGQDETAEAVRRTAEDQPVWRSGDSR
ncbi:hypothetical protein EDC65_5183 [Stella humosa]|uniref:Uncharacterized protein n=1 Tax=Stella humosa TaxID=94 RepID=A0A3N1KT95_9PROT|nr:hypothetical protein [Stella humosa]ROP81326.1 hypothetical protein EDC65_5183 [Stella humosa]BBK32676.1 hypothetical protein STHU_33100 [Stella humosa]